MRKEKKGRVTTTNFFWLHTTNLSTMKQKKSGKED